MKISATSALVLNWTDTSIWQSHEALSFTSRLDLSEGDPLLKLFSEEENFMHLQVVSGRKYFMKKKATDFLNHLKMQDRRGQVIVFAAGIAPLSIEIASLFPSCIVFDVDKFHMEEKKKSVNGNPTNTRFIECDITDIEELGKKLSEQGFDPDVPTIAVMEGIIYYLTSKDFRNILKYLNNNKIVLACDFCLKPELVNEKTRYVLTEVFRKIKEQVHLDFVTFYSEEEITQLIAEAGFKKIQVTNMQQVQKERTDDEHPFVAKNSSWAMTLFAE